MCNEPSDFFSHGRQIRNDVLIMAVLASGGLPSKKYPLAHRLTSLVARGCVVLGWNRAAAAVETSQDGV